MKNFLVLCSVLFTCPAFATLGLKEELACNNALQGLKNPGDPAVLGGGYSNVRGLFVYTDDDVKHFPFPKDHQIPDDSTSRYCFKGSVCVSYLHVRGPSTTSLSTIHSGHPRPAFVELEGKSAVTDDVIKTLRHDLEWQIGMLVGGYERSSKPSDLQKLKDISGPCGSVEEFKVVMKRVAEAINPSEKPRTPHSHKTSDSRSISQ